MPKPDGIYIAIESVIAVLAILGNVLVIWVVKVTPEFQKKTIYYFIASLAVADIAVGLAMPVAIVVSLGIPMAYEGCLFMCCLLMIFTQASILSLLAIAIDRYLKVQLLTRYKITTEKRVWIILVAIWFLSLLVGFVPMFGFAHKKTDNSNYTKCQFTNLMKMDYLVYLSFFAGTLVPLILMCILYTKIFCIIRTKLKHCSMTVKRQGIFYRHEFKTAKSLALVLFLFALCWLPICIMNCITYFGSYSIPQCVTSMGILLSHSHSVMNPIVYAFRIKKFRGACLQILRTYILHTDPTRDAPNVNISSKHYRCLLENQTIGVPSSDYQQLTKISNFHEFATKNCI
ncbi:adenosine receptor A3-like [Elgaria multicarinata webbii]|uniref:adenosine receptor A3-like n=1 Tax=Elgaria multicarinata webbii TaxID=159646 RepID=UPI002FCCD871